MNTKKEKIVMNLLHGLALVISLICVAAPYRCDAQSTDKFYYWVDGGDEGYVLEVDANMKAQIETSLANGGGGTFRAHIAAGSVPYDKNYYSPTHAVWNWHVVSVDAVGVPISTLQNYDPPADDSASTIAIDPNAWIQRNGDVIRPRHFFISQEINPTIKDAVANVSNRGMTGAGEKTLITGLIVTGGEPRNILFRALGPSLSAFGIQHPVAVPRIDVFQGSHRIATNLLWKKSHRASEISQNYPSLAPTNDNEAALLLTLLPGAYTIQASSEDGIEGVAVIEAYDVDSSIP